ncbi:HTH-type transcriptional regulator LrpA [uncultured archaeon]|nr:HTH-type transcriptional regulator LrpA [uncultured archaeon]
MPIELDKIDKRILFELDRNCRIPETRLAKIVGKSKEAVRYRVKNLRASGVIVGYSAHINMGLLGYRGYKVYLKIREKPLLKRQFLEHLESRKDIYWVGVGDGAWSIGITFFARSNDEFYEKKNELYAKYRDLVLSEVNGSIVEVSVFGKELLVGEERAGAKPLKVFERGAKPVEIDGLERKILGALLRNSRIKIVELAGQCGTSIEVVRNRMKRLEDRGVIQGYIVQANYQKLGLESYKTFLYLEGLSPKMQKKVFDIAHGHPNVLHVVKTIAPWAVELEVLAPNYAQYNEVVNYIRRELADVLINVESTNLSQDRLFPSKTTVFDD